MLIAETGRDSDTTARRRRAPAWALLLLLFVFAPCAQADPIIGTHNGCVTALPTTGATWTATRHFQFVASWDPVAGCNPTIHHAMVLHEWLVDFDGTGGLKVTTKLDWFPTCGRIQFDAQSYVDATSNVLDAMGLVSLVFDTGVDCDPAVTPPASAMVSPGSIPWSPAGAGIRTRSIALLPGPPSAPAVFPALLPDWVSVPEAAIGLLPSGISERERSTELPPSVGEVPEVPELFPDAREVPEPTSLLLLGTGVALLGRRIRRR